MEIDKKLESVANINYNTDKIKYKLEYIAPVIDELCKKFNDRGYELALVGGIVRDIILGKTSNDIDLTTSAHPDQILEIIKNYADTIWDSGRIYGTIKCMINGNMIEITTYRSEKYDPNSRKPQVFFGNNITDDLKRRDLTINAIAVKLPQYEIEDPYNGIYDIDNKILKTPNIPDKSFSDDPLRMLRVIRFMSQLGFTIDDNTSAAIYNQVDRIRIISKERMRDELIKIICSDNLKNGFIALVEFGIADIIMPNIAGSDLTLLEILDRGSKMGIFTSKKSCVYDCVLSLIDEIIIIEKMTNMEPNFIVRLAALICGIRETNNIIYRHNDKYDKNIIKIDDDCALIREQLKSMRFSNKDQLSIVKLVNLYSRYTDYKINDWSDTLVRQYISDSGSELQYIHLLIKADYNRTKNNKSKLVSDNICCNTETYIKMSLEMSLDSARNNSVLNGYQIMTILNIKPGIKVGQAQDYLRKLQIERGHLTQNDAEIALLSWQNI